MMGSHVYNSPSIWLPNQKVRQTASKFPNKNSAIASAVAGVAVFPMLCNIKNLSWLPGLEIPVLIQRVRDRLANLSGVFS